VKTINKKLSPGLTPPGDYNELVQIVREIQNMSGGGGIEITKGPGGWLISFVRVPLTILTISQPGLLVTPGTVIAGKIRVVRPFVIEDVSSYVGVESTNGNIDLDIHLSTTADETDLGTTIYNKGSTKPIILQDEFIVESAKPDTLSISAGEFLHVDVDSVGEGAENLTVEIFGRE
jgi:hypothetical protein